MVLFEPGTMRVDAADRKLPGWLFLNISKCLLSPFPRIHLDAGSR